MDIVWLSSYPKSGNTWLRFFLYAYYYGVPKRSNDVSKRIPDLHKKNELNTALENRTFVKTHFMYSDTHPFISHTDKVIYVLRHPKDVLLSNYNYFRLGGFPYAEHEFARQFIAHHGVPYWKRIGIGSWVEHVQSWLDHNPYPCLALCFEDMKKDAAAEFRKVVLFLDGAVDEARLKQAVYQCSFGQMRKLEDKEVKKAKNIKQEEYSQVFHGDQYSVEKGYRFINKGAINQKLSHLSTTLDADFDAAFGVRLRELGY
ncbi:MAG: sulfotransferase domain-containing protein [Thiogranum sp.]|nr:sulfotransferase domain-containing protein [Thiogranum sp.]